VPRMPDRYGARVTESVEGLLILEMLATARKQICFRGQFGAHMDNLIKNREVHELIINERQAEYSLTDAGWDRLEQSKPGEYKPPT